MDFEGIAAPQVEEQRERLKEFVLEHAKQLREIEDALDESFSEVWDPLADPIFVSKEPKEQVHVRELIQTDNKVFQKILTVFAVVCDEIEKLSQEAEEKFYPVLSLFGERVEDREDEAGELPLIAGKLLPVLLDLRLFVQHSYTVIKNAVSQVASLFHERQPLYGKSFRGVQLQPVFLAIGKLLRVFITLDLVIRDNPKIEEAFNLYKRTVRSASVEPTAFDVKESEAVGLDAALNDLEQSVLSGIYLGCVNLEFHCIEEQGMTEARKNKVFMGQLAIVMKMVLEEIVTKAGETGESDEREKLVGLAGLYGLYVRFMKGREIDKRLSKGIAATVPKIPAVWLYGRSVFFLPEFMAEFCGYPLAGGIEEYKTHLIKKLDDSFPGEIQHFSLRLSMWMVKMESSLNKVAVANVVYMRSQLVVEGCLLMKQMRQALAILVMLHLQLSVPFRSSLMKPILTACEMIKAIGFTFHRRCAVLAEAIPYMVSQLGSGLEKLITPLKSQLEKQLSTMGTRPNILKVDKLAEVTLMYMLCKGCGGWERRLVLSLVADMVEGKGEDMSQIKLLLQRLQYVADIDQSVYSLSDMSFLFWARDIFANVLDDAFQRPHEAHKLVYTCAAICDSVRVLSSAVHEDKDQMSESFVSMVEKLVEEHIVEPLCRAIETDLRLHIHSAKVLNMDTVNPFKSSIQDMGKFLDLRPVKLAWKTLDIRHMVTHYLDSTFYNLTCVAQSDWKTYGEMRNLAQQKYGLELAETHLPGQTLEQGLDVLEIMRNIHIFVARYDYNLNNQIFVEKPKDQKFLNTIGIRHIANSIRTHGTGIMATTVNFTYQYLARKFVIFSQFLYDDHIKSRLIKDIRFYKENREKLDNKYPMERAEKFNKDIRKLGVVDGNLTYLDQFRILITEMGNALGYVRMIRSGGLNFCSKAVEFVPDLTKIINFEEHSAKFRKRKTVEGDEKKEIESGEEEWIDTEPMSEATIDAAKNLDNVLANLTTKFAEGTDYFKLLVQVFASQLRTEENRHLRNFFIIIPPLCVNFVDHMLRAKDKLFKTKHGRDGCFTDDGFAIGIAYLLKVLGQDNRYSSLHWYESVKARLHAEKVKLMEEAQAKKKANDEQQQTVQLAMSRLKSRQMEFDLLYYSLSGARIFFRDQ